MTQARRKRNTNCDTHPLSEVKLHYIRQLGKIWEAMGLMSLFPDSLRSSMHQNLLRTGLLTEDPELPQAACQKLQRFLSRFREATSAMPGSVKPDTSSIEQPKAMFVVVGVIHVHLSASSERSCVTWRRGSDQAVKVLLARILLQSAPPGLRCLGF